MGVALFCLAGCSVVDSHGTATEVATEAVRSRAALARRAADAVLADADTAALGPEGRLDALAEAAASADRDGTVFARRATPDGRYEVDVAYDGVGSGGGFVAAEVHIRLCVRLAGAVDPNPGVTMVDVTCGAELDRRPGRIDKVVRLSD
ncbi:hypothetical protein O7602_29375 [Micromonospora sp. WMMD1128]|uniref:hypothetical protein n=1 Tax=Micromonospora sp. WMMD1128 TaxID=3015150 RepID=UPI00248D2E62|nr:hypothetical protein [Micromonospora sp. WMMD1128]WBB73717.1 hypothetical protein O7602_29375 [Micromonospora sp. WMMD1128]